MIKGISLTLFIVLAGCSTIPVASIEARVTKFESTIPSSWEIEAGQSLEAPSLRALFQDDEYKSLILTARA